MRINLPVSAVNTVILFPAQYRKCNCHVQDLLKNILPDCLNAAVPNVFKQEVRRVSTAPSSSSVQNGFDEKTDLQLTLPHTGSTDRSCSHTLRSSTPKALNAAATTPCICWKSPFPSPSRIPAERCSGRHPHQGWGCSKA